MAPAQHQSARRLALFFFPVLGTLLAACSAGPVAQSSAVLRSPVLRSQLRTDLATQVYSAGDRSTADFYLSDLPAELLSDQARLATQSGSIIHIHLFITPKAGQTPLDPNACSVAIRQIVLSAGSVGVYAGGGFLNVAEVGNPSIHGNIREATLRLAAASPTFDDRLGPCEMAVSFTARRDEPKARAIGLSVQNILRSVPEVKSTPAATP